MSLLVYNESASAPIPSPVAALAAKPGIDGYYYRFRAKGSLKQDSAGTGAVAVGDPVGYALDQLALNNGLQATAGSRLTATTRGAKGDAVADYINSGQPPFATMTRIICMEVPYDPTLAAPAGQSFIGAAGASNANNYLAMGTDGKAAWALGSNSASAAGSKSTKTLPGLRVVVAMTLTGSTAKIFVNGKYDVDVTGWTGTPTTTINDYIAARNANGTAAGWSAADIEQALLVNYVMTDAEIAQWSALFGFDEVVTKAETLTLVSTQVYPLLGSGKYPVPTGLARWGTKWVVGDGGVGTGLNSTEPGVVIYDANLVELARFTAQAMGLTGYATLTAQGIAVDSDNTAWVVFRGTSGSNSVLVHLNLNTGAVIGTTSLSSTMNGLAIDTVRNLLYGMTEIGTLNRALKASPTSYLLPHAGIFANTGITGFDHLSYIGSDKMLFTFGANGSDGHVYLLDMTSAQPAILKDFTLPGCYAIEGAVYVEESGVGYIYVNNDQRFHPAEGPDENSLFKYGPVSLT